MTPSPPGAARAVWILARTGLRRWVNRLGAQFRRKKKREALDGPRRATPRKARGSAVLMLFLGACFMFNGCVASSRFLDNLARALAEASAPEGLIVLNANAYSKLQEAEKDLKRLASGAAPAGGRAGEAAKSGDPRDLRAERLERLAWDLSWPHMHGGGDLDKEERETQAREWVQAFTEKGLPAFRERARPALPFFEAKPWSPEQVGPLVRCVGLFLLVMGLCLVLGSLGMANQDLGSVSWHLEWLFTLPVPARTFFIAKTLEYALLSGFGWFLVVPFLITLCWTAGYGGLGVPMGLGAAAAVLLAVGSVRLVLETWLRKRCNLTRLKNLQALFTLLGIGAFGALCWVALSPEVPAVFLSAGRRFPELALWNPFSISALLCRPENGPWIAGGLVLTAVAFPWASTRIAERLVRDGLLVAGGAYQGTRARAGALRERRSWLPGGIIGKDLRLLLRDRNMLVQTVVVPIFMLGMQLIINPRLLTGIGSDPRHVAVFAFGVGAYVMVFSAFQVLTMEGNALWILYTLPCDLARLLFRKSFLWAGVGVSYALLILASAAVRTPSLDALAVGALAVAGVALHGFIAAALGILATDPLETEASRKINPVMIYLYLFLTSLYANAIYNPSAWGRIAQLVLSIVLAFALWQKVIDRLPFLLDSTASPPPRIALSDGLIAALVFFVLQSLLAMAFVAGGCSAGESLFYAFTLAGLIAGAGSLYIFWRSGVPGFAHSVGLRFPAGAASRALRVGVPAGIAAALFGWAYLNFADRFESLLQLKDQALQLRSAVAPTTWLWVGFLAVAVAPLFEEYIFRGLVYRGLRRSAGVFPAVLMSAALFAVVHPPIAVIPVFVLGLAAAVSFERTGNLLAPVLTHAIYNAVMVTRF